ncbi:MAG TPA: hypothetical protein VH186_06650 [Chloroflexia bacterium]|nr:hypothetical protein [Chloroflexia bacterium]
MKRNLLLVLIAGLVALSLVACGDSTPTIAPAATAASSAATAVATAGSSAATAVATAVSGAAKNPSAELKNLGANLTAASDALKKNDITAAKASFQKFDDKWDDVEDYVKDASKDLYKEIEDNITAVKNGLRADQPNVATIQKSLDTLQQKYNEAIALVSKA